MMEQGAMGDYTKDEKASIPLSARFPDLEGRLPRIPLGNFPTPVERLAHLGHGNLWIKRDDLTSDIYGGNKVRKLEFLLGDALRRRCRKIITMGGIGTNHGLATAIYAHREGLACRLILFPQPVNDHVRRNMLLFCKYGAELRCRKGPLSAGAWLLLAERLLNPRGYILEAGGSSPVGTLGFVNAMLELKDQVDAGLLPEPRYVICPVGSNGTMAGLSLGALLAGLDTTVVGVRVTMERLGLVELSSAKAVERLMTRTLALLRQRSAMIPRVAIPPQRILGDYLGDGYGCATDKCLRAMELLRDREGIALDPTYTGKAAAALLDFIAEPGHAKEPVLYWHTYSSADLAERLRGLDCGMLPPDLRRLYEGG